MVELRRCAPVAEIIPCCQLSPGPVAPLIWIADFRQEGLPFFKRFLPGGLTHPVQCFDSCFQRRAQTVNERLRLLFGIRREMLLDVELSQRHADCVIHRIDQRCQRGVISFCPLIVLPKKAKFSFWNADERCGAASLSVWKRRYACHCSTGVSVSIALTSAKNLAGASENPFFTSAPCALKNAPQSRRGVMALASSTLTKWYRFSGSRSSAGKSEAFARRVSNANTCAA